MRLGIIVAGGWGFYSLNQPCALLLQISDCHPLRSIMVTNRDQQPFWYSMMNSSIDLQLSKCRASSSDWILISKNKSPASRHHGAFRIVRTPPLAEGFQLLALYDVRSTHTRSSQFDYLSATDRLNERATIRRSWIIPINAFSRF